MTDRMLTPKEKNIIDSFRKLATQGVFHNFMKDPEIIAFNSELANNLARLLLVDAMKVSLPSRNNFFVTSIYPSTSASEPVSTTEEIADWLETSCCGKYIMIDYNVFFELEEDRTSFILTFSN